MNGPRPSTLLREARRAAGVSQERLARRASTTQPAISQYESGKLEPTLATFERLAASAGFDVHIELVPSRSLRGRVLAAKDAISELAEQHGLSNVRLFGSVARGEDHSDSDIDLIVDASDTASLFDTFAFAAAVEQLLGVERRVDVTSSRVLEAIPAEAVAL